MIPQWMKDRIRSLSHHRVVVGLSGGVDSMVLLELAVAEFGNGMHAFHVNHGLHDNANRWEAHCRERSAALGVGFTAVRVTVPAGGSVETNARDARYEAFERFLVKGDVLLLAHHRDDQVETILQTLFRGTGRFGVSGMPAERPIGVAHLMRPLLEASRGEIEDYARAQGLSWIDDPGNGDEQMNRNWLRHTLLPAVEARWPQAREALLAAAGRDEGYRQIIDFAAETDLAALRDGVGLNCERLFGLPPVRRLSAVRHWIAAHGLPMPGDAALGSGLGAIERSRDDGAPLLCWQNVCLRRFDGRLLLTAPIPDDSTESQHEVRVGEMDFGVGRLLIANEINKGVRLTENCRVVSRREGMEIRIRHRRPLKKVLQEARVPPWLRPHLPLVVCGSDVVAIAGLPDWGVPMAVADGWQAGTGENGVRLAFLVANQPYSD